MNTHPVHGQTLGVNQPHTDLHIHGENLSDNHLY